MAEEKKYGIGEVQELLRKEFPDITISKIRFLEKEGLIDPERTPSGYRKYSRTNIKQLSYILRLQREEYLPLSVIKRKIQDLKSGKVVAGDMTVMSGQSAEPALTGAVPVSTDLAPSKLGLSPETLKELVDYGIVKVHEGPEGKYFPPSEMKKLQLAKEFFRYGVEPRHLRMFTQFVGREASFIEQIIRPQLQHKDPNTKRSAIKDLENLIALSQMFILSLLRDALSGYLPRPATLDLLEEDGQAPGSEDMPRQEDSAHLQPDQEQPARTDDERPQPVSQPPVSAHAANAQPTVSAQPVANAQPTVSAQPVANAQPTVSAQPAAITQPAASTQPVVSAQRPGNAQTPVNAQPPAGYEQSRQTTAPQPQQHAAAAPSYSTPSAGGALPAQQPAGPTVAPEDSDGQADEPLDEEDTRQMFPE